MAPKRDRTFTGCFKCRTRKVKCDERQPGCTGCQRLKVKCPGYGIKYTWVQEDGSIDISQGRRSLPCDKTWKGFETLNSDVVDALIDHCDEENGLERCMSTMTLSRLATHNPFSVLTPEIRPDRLSRNSPASETDYSLDWIMPQLTPFPDLNSNESFLFHHYASHVAIIMMPYEHPQNPWQSHYPAVALHLASSGQNSFYNALIAHASFNVARLLGFDESFTQLAWQYYGIAIGGVIEAVGKEKADFSATMASIMTLMFAELYSGGSRTWRQHYDGAWELLQRYFESEPWKSTDLTRTSLQSLNIIKIIGDTSRRRHHLEQDDETQVPRCDSLASSPVQSMLEFGFTIGAPKVILESIARITEFQSKSRDGQVEYGDVEDFLCHELLLLGQYRTDFGHGPDSDSGLQNLDLSNTSTTRSCLEMKHQEEAFIQATYIYLYRMLLNVPPAAVKHYVEQTLLHVFAFSATSSGNFSIWPAFIAAVEACSNQDLALAQQWLLSTTSFGIGSRDSVKQVVEESWRRRDGLSKTLGLDPEFVVIDWRDVMEDLGLEILLI